jgi:hypothetical protein
LADPSDTTTGFIYSWNGFEVQQEQVLAVSGHQGAAMATYLNSLVVTVRSAGLIYVRDVTGSWSTYTVASFDSSGYFNSMATLKDKLYIMSGSDKVYEFNGSALSLSHTITGGTSPEEANCCVAWNGRLYYTWSEFIASDGVEDERWPWLGYFDPDTADPAYDWKDDYVDFGHQTGTRSVTDGHDTGGNHPYLDWGVVTALAVYRQRLMAAVGTVNITTKYSNIVTHDVTNNPYSNWYIAHPNAFVITPTGPVYFSINVAAGSSSQKNITYFKVL